MTPLPPAAEDIANRRPVWDALSSLFLDTDTSLSRAWRVRILAESTYSVEQLEWILAAEIHPVCRWNLLSVAGEWTGFDLVWLESRILRRLRSPLRFLRRVNPGRVAAHLSSEWEATKQAVAVARDNVISIRRLMPQDFPHVLSLNGEAQPHVARLDEAELMRLHSLSQIHLVAEQRGDVSGYVLAFARGDAYDGEEFTAFGGFDRRAFIYIDQVATRRSSRGAGVARRLYAALELGARANGVDLLCCEVNTSPPNPGSLSFHQRLGFKEVGALATRDGREVALLSKGLT